MMLIARTLLFSGVAAILVSCSNPPKPTLTSTDGATSSASASGATSASGPATPVDAIPIPSASVMARVNPTDAPAYTGPTGSLEGTLTYVGDPPRDTPTHADAKKCPRAEDVYGKEFRLGDPTGDGRKLGDAVVVITGYNGFYLPETHDSVESDIEGCAISSRTIVMTFGQRLLMKNLRGDLVAPLLDKARNGAFMVAVPGSDAVKLYPRKPGRYLMTDNMGKTYFSNDVFVLAQPLHGVTDLQGHFRIDGVPVGKLRVNAMHPAFRATAEADVEILPGAVAHVDLTITRKHEDAGAPAPTSTARLPR